MAAPHVQQQRLLSHFCEPAAARQLRQPSLIEQPRAQKMRGGCAPTSSARPIELSPALEFWRHRLMNVRRATAVLLRCRDPARMKAFFSSVPAALTGKRARGAAVGGARARRRKGLRGAFYPSELRVVDHTYVFDLPNR